MAPDPASGRRSVSPESSGRDSPIPRQWRNQLGNDGQLTKDKAYRRYATGVEKALSFFETTLEEWADYISFLNRLLKSLQARPSSITAIPAKATVAQRLSQCLNPSLPSGVHQKALEVYNYVFATIGRDGLSRDLPLYLPGLASTLSFASLTVRSPYLDILERHFLKLDPRSLRPAMRSIILALLPGLEEETAEDFDRTLKLVASFKEVIRTGAGQLLTDDHASDDYYFWQCFFLASITGHSRRSGALAYLVRFLPPQGSDPSAVSGASQTKEKEGSGSLSDSVAAIVTSPEPGLLLRCFASGLSDDQLLIQRGFLDLLVTHLPLNSSVLQSRVKSADLELLLKAAVGVVTRRDMSLNRRLWAWFLGPEPAATENENSVESPLPSAGQGQGFLASRTTYFEEFGLQALIAALLSMIKEGDDKNATERARPYRICLSLMDRWEIGGLVVPEVFLPIIESVRRFRDQSSTKSEFTEVLRSASVFFDGIESGLIYSELVGQLAKAIRPGSLTEGERSDKLALVSFILANFNVREEEMVTFHAPLSCLAALAMLEETQTSQVSKATPDSRVLEQALNIAISLLELVPERSFPSQGSPITESLSNMDLLKKIQSFYVHEQGTADPGSVPFTSSEIGELLLHKTLHLVCEGVHNDSKALDLGLRIRLLILTLVKTPSTYKLDVQRLLTFLQQRLESSKALTFSDFSSTVQLSTELHAGNRIDHTKLSQVASQLVRHGWAFLAASKPKFHVETVRCLWQLQTALSLSSRDIEAALATLLVTEDTRVLSSVGSVDKWRNFSVLWSHTLQDNPSDRRNSKASLALEYRSAPRLAGMDNFEVMLTRPVFLILDALLDERTQLYMTVKSWLNSMIGIDRLFLIFVYKFSEVSFLQDLATNTNDGKAHIQGATFSEDDDLDLCLYYLRTLSNVLRNSADISWAVLATKHLSFIDQHIHISTGGEENSLTLQDFFVQVCLRCITSDAVANASEELDERVSQLYRFALNILHQVFLHQRAVSQITADLENLLLDRLFKSIGGRDLYVQVLFLDVVYDTLKLRDASPMELPMTPPTEKRTTSLDPARNSRPSMSTSDVQQAPPPPPPQLLKCLQTGLGSANSRPVLDSWIAFLAECLPFYSTSIFQVLIPLVETLCREIGGTFTKLKETFQARLDLVEGSSDTPESTLIYLLNGLEQVLARAHEQLLTEEARDQLVKGPEQPQSIFGSMVSGVFQSDAHHSRSATANDRLTVHLAFQDATRICYRIWSWGLGEEAARQEPSSNASFNYTSLRMRNRARRLLEQLFSAETLECLETVIDIWRSSDSTASRGEVFNLLSALEASRPRHAIPALFNSIYSRTNPGALEPTRKSTMTVSLEESDLVVFLVEYARSLDDDAMDEIWQDYMIFLKDLLSNPFPHRQNLPSLLEFAAILGEKVDNTNFGEQRKMRRELGDLFLRLLAALFTTRPMSFSEPSSLNGSSEKTQRVDGGRRSTLASAGEGPEDVVAILATIVPNLSKILVESDRVLSAASSISNNVIGPTLRSKIFPDNVSPSTLKLMHELSRLQNNQKTWKKDVSEAFNDYRFFAMNIALVKDGWLPLLKQWTVADKEKMPEIVSRITAPTTAGIVFGVGATSARLESDRKTQVNLRRIATLILASSEDAFVADLPEIFDKLAELLGATATSSPSSTTRADVYMVVRALVLRISPIHLAMLWPVVNGEIHAALSSVVAPDNSTASDTYTNASILQACKVLDLLLCIAPDDFQLHEWLFITDTIDAVYRSSGSRPVALVDELSEELGSGAAQSSSLTDAAAAAHLTASSSHRRPLLGIGGGISDDVGLERKDELVGKVLRPFFGQLSIYAFESTYAMGAVDRDACEQSLLKDVFDERSIVRAP